MFTQQRTIIPENEEVRISHGEEFFYVKKKDLYSKVEILCRNKENTELSFILGTIISVQAIQLKKGVIDFYFKKENVWANKPEARISNRGDLYKLLKGMKHFD